MKFGILGPLEVHEEGRALDLGAAKQRSLLAVLVLNANQVVSSDGLIDSLWGERPPETAAKALQVYVSQLRKVLGRERLRTKPSGYLLRLDGDELDLHRVERLVNEATQASSEAAAAKLREALSLWRGPPLAEFAYQGFAQSEIARIEELRLTCLEERLEADLAQGRHAALVGELEALVQKHPLRERLRAQLMLSLYRSGRQADALESYKTARRRLVDELGIEPSKPLRELHQQILRQDPTLDDREAVAAALAEPSRGVFVGRERELAELLAGLDAVFAGHGRLFLLSGEPGIGKSRLTEELIAHARARGARVLVGRCWEAGGAPAYWPWVQPIRAYARESDPAALRSQLGGGARDLAQIVPELREQFPDLPEPHSLESEGARFRLFDATADFFRNASKNEPILLVLDDLHAADAPSLLLLQFLARELGSTRLLLLGAYRSVDPTPEHPLTAMLADVAREPVTRHLSLGGLSEGDVATYVELTASEIASPELIAALHEETEGNPLFVGEIVRLLSVEGVRPESTAEVRLAIPQSVHDVIARRLTHLSEECNRLLVMASVLGREFALDALACLSGVSEDELLDTLDEAMAARVISDVPGSPAHLRFAHVLMRDTLYEGLTTARRVRLHRQAVAALEALYGDEPGPHLAELVHHSIAGSEFDKGLHYAQRAGDRALALLAYEEAARLYETALEALDLAGLSDESTRCELLLALGEAEARAGNSPEAKRAFLVTAGIARGLGLPRELARAAAGYGGRIVWTRAGNDHQLVPLLEEGLASLADEDVELRARLLARLAGALRDEPSRDRRDRLSKEAVELARRAGNPAALAYALDGRAAAILAPDTVAERLALGSELRDVAERIGDGERVVQAHVWRFVAQIEMGDTSRIDLAAAIQIAEELRQPAQLFVVTAARAMLALASGRLAEAEELVPQAFALGERAQPEAAIPIYGLQRYALCDLQGGLEEVEPAIRELVAEYPARPALRCVLAHLYTQLGRTNDARREFDDLARDGFSVLPFDMEWLYGMSLLAETCTILSDRESAGLLYQMLLPYAAFNAADQPEGMRGSVSRYLGLLATATERFDDAQRHFEDAIAMNARMGARPWLAHTQHDYARMLLARDAPRDPASATELLASAKTTCQELGMTGLATRADALLEELDARPARPS
jgi:DNA-binding SARP family transcriptional activator/tetratricopeptide (TPR) repeat protein